MYKYLNEKFINSSLKVKIELYLLPLLVLYLFYYWIVVYKDEKIENIKKNEEVLINKAFDENYLKFYSSVENIAIKNNIFIKSISRENKIIEIDGLCKDKAFFDFLNQLENLNNFTKISFFSLKKEEFIEEFLFQIKIDLNEFYIKDFTNKEITTVKNKPQINSFKLYGIVDNYAFINDKWIKINEKIDNFELKKIEKSFVLLQKEDLEIRLELIHEEYSKRVN